MTLWRDGFARRHAHRNATGRHHLMQGLQKAKFAHKSRLGAMLMCVGIGITQGEGLDRHLLVYGRFKQIGVKRMHL